MSSLEAENRALIITLYAVKITAVVAFLLWTNEGFLQRITALEVHARWVSLIGFIGVWGLSVVALFVAAFQPNRWLRFGWALLIGFTTAVGFAWHRASGSDFGLFDALSVWGAWDQAARGIHSHTADFYWLAVVMCVGFIVLAVPPVPRGPVLKRWSTRAGWVPALPIAAISAIVLLNEGGGSQVLPTQFAPISIGIVMGLKVADHPMPHRSKVSWTWHGPFVGAAPRAETLAPRAPITHVADIRRVVILVDESVRGDYIDWTPGNPYTPELARLKDRIVDFGPASSGGNCSSYSNAILRFAAARDHLGHELLSTPTIWQYAKKAGFRTIYIDGQTDGVYRDPGKLMNFMTVEEARDIEGFFEVEKDSELSSLDDRLLDIILRELKSDKPVLIYANKNGAHVPYDVDYPKRARYFRPTLSDVATDSTESRVNSYRNAVRWSVDRIFKRLFDEWTLKDTVIIYTSDHGQAFNPGRLTHCTTKDTDPREGLVPLFVITDNEQLRARFTAAANTSRGHGSHFSIIPTVLELIGYSDDDIAKNFGASLLTSSTRTTEFTTGDIFGLFTSKPRWHSIDLNQSYLEPAAKPELHQDTSARAGKSD